MLGPRHIQHKAWPCAGCGLVVAWVWLGCGLVGLSCGFVVFQFLCTYHESMPLCISLPLCRCYVAAHMLILVMLS